jgi:hypothetical protein
VTCASSNDLFFANLSFSAQSDPKSIFAQMSGGLPFFWRDNNDVNRADNIDYDPEELPDKLVKH